MKPVAQIRRIEDKIDRYESIVIWCPGCQLARPDGTTHGGLHMLPISGDSTKRPTWNWNGNLESVTLTPSILTKINRADGVVICHSFLTNGVWNFLADSTHELSGKNVPMVELPDWVVRG